MKTKLRENKKVVFITGASSGIGKACAEYLAKNHFIVYGTGRREKTDGGNFHFMRMDVTQEDNVAVVINKIISDEGKIDIVINNAGINLSGAIEETSDIEAKHLFETNFFGVLRVIRHVLPHMIKQQSGVIINISSLGGRMGLPFQGLYCAGKFALEGLTESLRMEIYCSGVRATLIEPGDFCTAITQNRIKNIRTSENIFYRDSFASVMNLVEKDENSGPDPQEVAKLVLKIIRKKNPAIRYTVGRPVQKLGVVLKKILPAGLFEMILTKKYTLS